MELDDFKQAWQALDRRLEQQNTLNLQLYRDARLDKARRSLRPLVWGQRLQIMAGVCVMLLFAPFWVEHLDKPHLMLSGLALHIYGLMFVLSAARNLYLVNRIDYANQVLDIQRQLATLQAWRERVEWPVFAVIGCFIWVPLILVIFAWMGADVWVNAPIVVWSWMASAFVCLLILWGVVYWMRRSGRGRVLQRSQAGKSVYRAEGVLEELARFEGG
ncbi:hypothetical protein DVJ77_03935 [Dyella tabacisoli]|uniref:Serine/threonine protein kinase n=2 Tax=Dyella tabacisoli TaxID=2282381 RepID=A0A369UTG7_9GAMM|nr:hypothetical protein DVJ77_03935 [Dyella tabacisoli]